MIFNGIQRFSLRSNTLFIKKISFGVLFTLIFLYIFRYGYLLTRVFAFHFLKYSALGGAVIIISRFIPKYSLSNRGYSFILFILVSLICWDTLSWCDFMNPQIGSSETPRYFIAGNLFNSEEIFDMYRHEMERFITAAGPHNVYISIVEDHSIDNTPELLREWSKSLLLKGVNNKIITSYPIPPAGQLGRIERLAILRNAALQPFFDPEAGFVAPFNHTLGSPQLLDDISRASRIIFINDIVFFKENIITLYNTNDGNYSATCAMDFDLGGLYDTWVVRDKQGKQLNQFYPYFHKQEDINLIINKQPIKVYSCWNGLVVFNPSLIVTYFDPHLINSTEISQKLKFRSQLSRPECHTSECFYIWYDLRRIAPINLYINPQVYNGRSLVIHRDMKEYDCWG